MFDGQREDNCLYLAGNMRYEFASESYNVSVSRHLHFCLLDG